MPIPLTGSKKRPKTCFKILKYANEVANLHIFGRKLYPIWQLVLSTIPPSYIPIRLSSSEIRPKACFKIYKYANELANLHILQPHQVPTPVLRLSLITSHYPYLPEHITFPHLPDHITSNWNIFTGDCAEDRGSMDFNWNSLIDYTLTTFQHGSGLT